MCDAHGPAEPPYPPLFQNREYADLGLSKLKQKSAHCQDCLHYVWHPYIRRAAFIIGALLLMLSVWLFVSWDQTEIGTETFILAVIILGLVGLAQIHALTQRYRRLPFPVIGKIQKSALQERMHGKITLDRQGNYISNIIGSPLGELRTTFRFTQQDKDRLEKYKKRFGLRRADPRSIDIHAGFVNVEGEMATFDLEQANKWRRVINAQGNIFELSSKLIQYPYLSNRDHGADQLQVIALTYRNENKKKKVLPIQILPQIDGDPDEYDISLTIQKNPKARAHGLNFKNYWIEQLTVDLSPRLGNLVKSSPYYEVKTADGKTTISWENIRGESVGVNADQKRVFLKFRKTANETETEKDEDLILTGTLKVAFQGTYSKMAHVNYYYPIGVKRDVSEHPETDFNSTVHLDFHLNLSSLKLFDYAAFTDEIREIGPMADHRLIARLTRALNRKDIYIKHVIENPATLKEGFPSVQYRLWDIRGRKYYGVYAIDFFIVLTGETSLRRNGVKQFPIRFDTLVRAPAINRDLSNKINQFRLELHHILTSVLHNDDDNPPPPPPPAPPTHDGPGDDFAPQGGINGKNGPPHPSADVDDDFFPPVQPGGGEPQGING
ncbi:MAG: hypothetical protein AAF633_09395 [Chloroflexota bacterium]